MNEQGLQHLLLKGLRNALDHVSLKKENVPERKPLFEVELSTYQGENLQGGGAEYDSAEKLGS